MGFAGLFLNIGLQNLPMECFLTVIIEDLLHQVGQIGLGTKSSFVEHLESGITYLNLPISTRN